MEDRLFQVSGRVTVLFTRQASGYYRPKVMADGESREIPLLFCPPDMGTVEQWLGAIEGLDEPLKLAYHVVAGALVYAQKYPGQEVALSSSLSMGNIPN